MKIIDNRLIADEGKTFKRVSDNEILDTIITLGKYDKAENYIEVDKPKDETEPEPIL